VPGLRLVAEGILGADSRIDFVGVDAERRLTLVLVGQPDEEFALLGRALAHRAWVEARLGDWLQLAPELGVRPEAGVALLLMSPGFTPEAEAAARSLGEAAPRLAVFRCVRNGAGVEALLEPTRRRPDRPEQPPSPPAAAPVPAFRTGLTDADLGLGPDERAEFE